MEFVTNSSEETYILGKKLASFLDSPITIALNGQMAAGKTHIAKGICSYFGVGREFSSPTYSIINKYSDNLYHMDAYRIEDIEELEYTGFYDIAGNGILLIEWATIIKDANFEVDLEINIIKKELDKRVIVFKGDSEKGKLILNKMEKENEKR